MVRKRSAWTRARDRGRKRRRRGPPTEGYTLAQLLELSGVSRRTIAAYAQRGLLVQPEFRGTATRYPRSYLLRLLGIRLLKADGLSSLGAIHKQLQAMGDREIERFVMSRQLSPKVAAALGQAPTAAGPSETTARPRPTAPTSSHRAETWQRLQLMPGLELLLRADATSHVQLVAAHLQAEVERLVRGALEAPKPSSSRA